MLFAKAAAKRFYNRLEDVLRSNPEINQMFPFEHLSAHYIYEPSRQTLEYPDVFINQVRYFRLYNYFKEQVSGIFSGETSVVNVGDTSGILLKALKKDGVSVNINQEVVSFLQKSGITAKLGNAENLPFDDKTFDYSFSFQCLEHVNNPVKALSELSRITRKKVFISIPYVAHTVIYSKDYWQQLKKKPFEEGGWNEKDVRDVDGHKFEFSTEDFKKILTYIDLKYIDNYPINYFSPLGSSRKNDKSYFNFFILQPNS